MNDVIDKALFSMRFGLLLKIAINGIADWYFMREDDEEYFIIIFDDMSKLMVRITGMSYLDIVRQVTFELKCGGTR